MRGLVIAVVVLAPGTAVAQRWQDATAGCLGTTAEWTNKVEVADVDGDGKIDLLLANGGDYASPGEPEPTRVFRNTWGAAANCSEISAQAVGGFTGLSRTIKAADIDGDGDLDLVTGGAYGTQLKLFVRGAAGWTDATAQLPQQPTSVGDAELGDVDDDGDLDLVLADWGGTNPATSSGGRTRLYLNDGAGTFSEATATQMPDVLVKWSWDLELADVDNDWDLDVLVACKRCTTSYLFRNDGGGHFTNDADALPHFSNNYEFEPMDIDADGDLDFVTINDGPNVTEHIFVNRGDGTFADETSARLTGTANPPGADDNVAVWLDHDADGDADLLIGSLGPDRLLDNDGGGHFTLVAGATPDDTDATLGLAVADFDGDGRLDLLQGQGEIAFPDKVQLGSAMIAVDTVAPVVRVRGEPAGNVIRARIHDFIGPSHVHDFTKVVAVVDGTEIPMTWYGGMLWRANDPPEPSSTTFQVCATDRGGNRACDTNAPVYPDGGMIDDAATGEPKPPSGGCCDAGGDSRGSLVLAMLACAVLSARSRSRAHRCGSELASVRGWRERHARLRAGDQIGAAVLAELDRHLGPVAADIAALELDRHVVWQRSRTTRHCNWKLVIEAFLDGYHIRVLHRDSVYRFFLDAASVAEPAGAHIRAITGRRALREAAGQLAGVDLRLLATPSLLLFPSTVVVEHPDFVWCVTLQYPGSISSHTNARRSSRARIVPTPELREVRVLENGAGCTSRCSSRGSKVAGQVTSRSDRWIRPSSRPSWIR